MSKSRNEIGIRNGNEAFWVISNVVLYRENWQKTSVNKRQKKPKWPVEDRRAGEENRREMFLSKTFISCVVSFICLLGWPKNLAYIKREKSDPRQRKTHKTFPRLCSIRIVQYITEDYFLQDAKLTRLFWRNLQPEACLVKIRTTKEQSACAIRTSFAMLPKKKNCRQAKIFFVSADFVV